jgi:hypothetical protein
MTSAQLRRRAEARGVTTVYRDWQDRKIQVSDKTLEAVLAVLGSAPPPSRVRPGAAASRLSGPLAAPWHPADHPAAPSGPQSGWGFTVQLYSVRSRQSWGHGDLRDLADLATWSGRALGAAFVLINPLHAAEPVPPVSASPYLPMSRRPGRPAAGRQLQSGSHRPRRGLGGQARRTGDRPGLAAGSRAPGRLPAVHRPRGAGA